MQALLRYWRGWFALAAMYLAAALAYSGRAAAEDGVYLDVSLGWAQGLVEDVHADQPYPVDWTDSWGHAQVELGVTADDWSLFAQHTSSPFTTHDQGVDVIAVRKRIWLSR